MRELVINPYEGIDWNVVIRKIGDFHQHSTESDGREHPAILIDQMVQYGRDIAVFTDHDSYRLDKGKYPKVHNERFVNTFPLSDYEGDLFYDPTNNGNYTELARVGIIGEFVRDGKGVMPNGLLAIQGNEVTAVGSINGTHDILSLFTDYTGLPENRTTFEALKNINEINGISIMAHPWKYEFSPSWYKEIIKKNKPSCLGIETEKTSFKLWDTLITSGLDIFPIWAFSNTDSHYGITNARYNVVFMNELSETELRTRLENGNFYSCHGGGTDYLSPVITKIDVKKVTKEITVTTENQNDVVKWVSCGKVVHIGNKLNYSIVKGISRYVRAEVINKGGHISCTNPFYFNRFITPKFN